MKLLKYILFIALFGAIYACSDMNDLHDKYLEDGETTYVGKIDSLFPLEGRDRVLLQYFITDPRAEYMTIFWNQKEDSINVDIPVHNPMDTLEYILNIEEGDYTLMFYSHDKRGHRSIKYEQFVNIYGERYESYLVNRPLKSAVPAAATNKLTVTFGGSSSTTEVGVEISYTKTDGSTVTNLYETSVLGAAVVLENMNLTQQVSYQTVYTPKPTCIDTFRAPVAEILN